MLDSEFPSNSRSAVIANEVTETPAIAEVVTTTESATSEVVATEAMPGGAMSGEPVADGTSKMSRSGPTHNSDIIRAGATALANQVAAHDWGEQKKIVAGLDALRTAALAEAKTNKPKGSKYCKALSRLLRLHGYERLDKSDRAKYLKIASNLAAVEAWRAADPKHARLHYGPSVWDAYSRSLSASSDDDDDGDSPAAPTLVDVWAKASVAERTNLFDTVPLEELRAAFSPAFAAKLISTVRVEALNADPDHALTNALRAALSYLTAADQSGEDADMKQAISAVRGINSMLRGQKLAANDVTAGILTPARAKILEKKKNRRRHR
jgi:hypothetical protein